MTASREGRSTEASPGCLPFASRVSLTIKNTDYASEVLDGHRRMFEMRDPSKPRKMVLDFYNVPPTDIKCPIAAFSRRASFK